MNYNTLVDPPVSSKYLKKVVESIFGPSYKNGNVTVLSGRGMGIASAIRYIRHNYANFTEFPQGRLYVMLDIELIADETKFYKEALTGLYDLVIASENKLLNIGEINVLKELISTPTVSFFAFADLVKHLTFDRNQNITFIFENFGLLYTSETKYNKNFETLLGLTKINPMKSSYIFLANHEFSTQHVLKLQGFGSYFTQSFVYGKDLVFDGECTEVLFSKHGKWQNHNFNKSGVNLIKKIAFGDPSIQKHIALSIINNPELEAQLLKAKDNKKIYSLLGEEFLDFRFEKIISSLFATTLDTLIAGVSKEDTSNFAVKLGLVHEDGTYINPLFEEFITRHKKTVTQRPSGPSSTEQTETRETTSRAELLTKLTAKELAIFETLENASPQVVSRDNLAEVLWGKDWLDNYSDWALNKQVSNLRQKIKQVGYAKEIKVLKTEGFMLR